MINFKRCPFCGSDKPALTRDKTVVACSNCGCAVSKNSRMTAVERWNNRVDPWAEKALVRLIALKLDVDRSKRTVTKCMIDILFAIRDKLNEVKPND